MYELPEPIPVVVTHDDGHPCFGFATHDNRRGRYYVRYTRDVGMTYCRSVPSESVQICPK